MALTFETLLTLERMHSQGQSIPTDGKRFLVEHTFHIQINQSRDHIPTCFLYQAFILMAINNPPCQVAASKDSS